MIVYRKLTLKEKEQEPNMKYKLLEDYIFTFCWFGKTYTKSLYKGMLSDGATGARDLGAKETGWRKQWSKLAAWLMRTTSDTRTAAWYVHDGFCNDGCWDCGTRVPNVVASLLMSIILFRDGYKREAFTWFFATLFGGGGKCRENGMLRVRRNIAKD